MDVNVKDIATEAEKVVETIMRVEPAIMTMASFIPGAKPVVAVVHPAVVALAPFLERALQQLASGNNGDALSSVLQLIQHISPGQPNAPILSATREDRENAMASQQGSG